MNSREFIVLLVLFKNTYSTVMVHCTSVRQVFNECEKKYVYKFFFAGQKLAVNSFLIWYDLKCQNACCINLWYNGTCLIQHIKGAGICVGLHTMLENSGFILVNRYTYGPSIFVGCHTMAEHSGVGLHNFHCTIYSFEYYYHIVVSWDVRLNIVII